MTIHAHASPAAARARAPAAAFATATAAAGGPRRRAGAPAAPSSSSCSSSHGNQQQQQQHPRSFFAAPTPASSPGGRRQQQRAATARARAGAPPSSSPSPPPPPPPSLFPAGRAQARVALPALFLVVRAAEALRMLGGDGGGGGGGASQQQQQQDQLDAAVAAGATAVLLVAGGGGDDGGSGSDGESTGGGGGAELYEAAVRLVAALRGRCPLLVEDRLDVATAAGCQGALLPESGVPVVVARRMVAASAGLLGRRAATAGQAAAAAADGANFVLMRPGCAAEEVTAARDRQRSGNAVPVLAEVVAVAAAGGGGGGGGGAGEGQPTPRLLAARADGLALPLAALAPVAAQLGGGAAGEGAGEAVATILAALRAGVAGGGGGEVAAAAEPQRGGRSPEARAAAAAAAAALPASQPPSAEPAAAATAATTRPTTPHSRPQPPRPRRRRLLTPAREALIADERALLDGAAALLSRVAPAVPELALLREAAAALEGRFSVAVVGEFNAGKSSVINALLGRRLLAEGPLPTTNEITELRYDDEAEELDGGGREEAARGGAPPPPPSSSSSSSSSIATAAADDDDDADQGRVVREADGRFVRYLRPGSAGAGLLREVNVVDTPGLNVVLERQERATEEYVPRADLVLFVMSADRPMTGSELRVLEYLRQWRKKVVFVLNKVDTLEDDDEGGDGDGGGGGGRGGGGRDGGRAGGGGRGASFSAAAAAAAGGSQGQGQGRSPSDRPNVRQVAEFVSSKAEELLAIARPAVLPVSARRALRAKLESAAAARAQLLEASSFSPPLSPEEVAASTASILARHPAWVPSGFGALEDFVYEFLAGGAEEDEEEARFGVAGGSGSGSGTDATDTGPPRGGEGLRLKLQTPLAVADALVGAAAAQLAAQRQGAEAQLRALSAVEGQLGRFGDAVRRDAASQRAAARALVDAAVERAGALVDRIVRLSNLGALSAYALGGGSGRRLPVAAAFDADVAAGGLEALSQRVAEHAGWLLANCESQSEYYAAYLASVPRPAGAAGAEGGGKQGASPAAPPAVAAAAAAAAAANANAANATPSTTTTTTTTAALVARSPALQAVAEFKPSAARAVLEEEVREAFLGTAGAAAGAQGAALIAAGLLPTGAEDAAAFAVASLASYVAVLNLPLRRAEIKAKVAKAAGRFADEVAARMEAEVDAATDATRAGVSEAAAPLVRAWEEELARVEGAERELAALAARLREMEVRVANV